MLGRSLLQRVAIKSAISQTLVNIRNRVSVVSSIRCPSVQRSFSTLGPKTTYTAVRDTNFVTLHSDRSDSADAVQKFPLVWLRDNCQCAQCFHHESSSRIIDWTRFDVNVQPETIEVSAERCHHSTQSHRHSHHLIRSSTMPPVI